MKRIDAGHYLIAVFLFLAIVTVVHQIFVTPEIPRSSGPDRPAWGTSGPDDTPIEQAGAGGRASVDLGGGVTLEVVTLDGIGREIRRVVDSDGRFLQVDLVTSPDFMPRVTTLYSPDQGIERRWQFLQHDEFIFSEDDREGEGRRQFLLQSCATCHGDDYGGSYVMRAPPLAGLPAWYLQRQIDHFVTGRRDPLPDPDPEGLGHGDLMVEFLKTLSGDEREWVASEIASRPPVPVSVTGSGDPEAGHASYRASCALCHGPEARGLEIQGGPPLRPLPGWALRRQMEAFRVGHRSGGPEALAMQVSVRELDEAVLEDILAWLGTLGPSR